MLAYIVHPQPDDPEIVLIRDLLAKLGCETIGAKSISVAAQDPRVLAKTDSIVVVPTTTNWTPDVGQLVRDASRLGGRAFLLFIADTISPGDYKALARLGAADSADWDSALYELSGIIERLKTHGADAGRKAPSDSAHHSVVSFVGTGGGAGNTTLALETGVLLASAKTAERRRVALLDLEFKESMVCDYLDISPRLDIDAFAHNPERLDDYMLDILASKHSSGLDVFACGKSVADNGGDTAIYLLLNRLLERYNLVLIDVPAPRATDFDEILKHSDFIFLTSLYSVPSVRRSHRLMQRIDGLKVGRDRRAVVINDADTNIIGAVTKRFDVETALRGERIFFVRRDRSFALECVDAGFSMMQTDSKRGICKDMAKISEAIEMVKPAVAA